MPNMGGPRSARQRALSQRRRDQAARISPSFTSKATLFERKILELVIQVCQSCRRKKESTDIRDGECSKCRRDANIFTPENGMDFGEVPSVLKDLTMVEEILIARVHPVVSVFKIRGQQTAYSGHVVNFNQHIQTIASRLPNNPRQLDSVLIIGRQTPSGLAQFRVRSRKIREALEWLKCNNRFYSDIEINEELLATLPRDDDIVHSFQNLPDNQEPLPEENADADNLINVSCFPNLPAVNQSDLIQHQLAARSQSSIDIGSWPALDRDRLNEFNTEGLICMAFPTLFPYGNGDLRAPRLSTITPHQYFKYLLSYQDGRFANHIRFPYYAYNTVARWDAINSGSVYVRHHHLQGLTGEDLAEVARDGAQNLAASIMYYGKNLRGTRAYWKQRCAELVQMVRQIGTPTIFFTLSAADYHWPDLFRLLGCTDLSTLTERDRKSLMHNNPATVAWFFQRRAQLFIDTFLRSFFPVSDYWFRYEWQHRGSPHVHGLLWFDGAPDCSNIDSLSEQERESIITYFDDLVSASINRLNPVRPQDNPCRQRLTELRPDEREFDLDKILTAVQRHSRCGSHCLRKRRGGRNLECRFKFPIANEDFSTLRKENGAWKFIPKRNDNYLQRYNPFITRLWRGNTDFSPITSKEAVINYISKYTAKAEYASKPYSDVLQAIIDRAEEGAPALQLVRQLLISSVAERNFSAQEVMHLIMGWKLYNCSRTIIILSLNDEWRRLDEQPETGLIRRYSCRAADLASLSLYEFSKNYRFRGQIIIRRAKECVVRVIPMLKLSDDESRNEEYYKLQCMLHVPWDGTFSSIKPDGMLWRTFYLRQQPQIENADSFPQDFPQLPDEFEQQEPIDEEDLVIRDAGMAAARIQPAQDQELDPMGLREVDIVFEWTDLTSSEISMDQIDTFLQAFRTMDTISGEEEEDSNQQIYNTTVLSRSMMSGEQAEVMDLLAAQVEDRTSIRRVIVQGRAGTGKSTLIKAMCNYLDGTTGRNSYQVLAPTGAAALNIDGKTIHSFLRIPVGRPLEPLNGEALRNFQLEHRHLRFVIIDEYSMVGLRMLHKIHSRLCEAAGIATSSFGAIAIYLFGDLRQLPPVMDIALYMRPTDDYSRLSAQLIRSFSKRITLSVCHRQADDQSEFRDILEGIAMGTSTREQWSLLMTRRRQQLLRPHSDEQQLFSNAVFLLPTNIQVKKRNNEILSANGRPVAIIKADHNNSTAAQGTDEQAQGLGKTLYLSIGCRIMLRKNICVEKGLVNGSLGIVQNIIYYPGERPPFLPYALLIKFDGYTGPTLPGNVFPLKPILASWKDGSVDCTRKQFPINLAYAITIHKSQGLTLDKIIVDIGDKEVAPGSTYVALSRVRKLEDLILMRGFDFVRLEKIRDQIHIIARERFLANFGNLDYINQYED